MKDSELLRLLRRDPGRGMRELSRQYAGLLCTVARARLPESAFGSGDIEDIVSDTLSAFYLTLDRYKPGTCSVKTYLCVMAKNRATDVLRRRRITPMPLGEGSDDSLDVADDLEEKELRARLLDGIKALGEPDSAILIRKYYLGQSTKAIAEALGLSVSNVDTRAHRAIRKLREVFKGE